MILAAGLLVLLGLGLFVAGIVTGVTALYWACVAACVVAAVLLVAVRRQIGTTRKTAEPAAAAPPRQQTTSAPAAPADAEADTRPEADAPPEAAPSAAESAPSVPHGSGAVVADVPPPEEAADPEVEEVEVTDLLLVVDLKDEVLVVDEHPRYHLAECAWLAGRQTFPLPLDEARSDGFTPCAMCSPDRTLASRARAAKHAGS